MSAWATVDVTVDTDTISDDVISVDIWREDQFYVSRAEIKLLNEADEWHADFNVSDVVVIAINGVTMFSGYLDDIVETHDDDGADYSVMVLKCRGYEFNLANLYITKSYPTATEHQPDDIIEDVLYEAQTGLDNDEKITYTSPSTAFPSEFNVKFKRGFLIDKFKEIAQATYYSGDVNVYGYGGYVDTDRALHFFPYGDAQEHQTTDLLLDTTTDSNVLKLLWGEQVGYNIRNYVEFYAGPVKDHWTDAIEDIDGVPIFTAGYNCTTPVAEYTIKMPRGVCSIAWGPSTANYTTVLRLSFPQFNYTSLNMSQQAENSVWFYQDYQEIAPYYFEHCRPRLQDGNGNVIEWIKEAASSSYEPGTTENIDPFYWHEIKFPSGVGLQIKSSSSTAESGFWYYQTAATTVKAPAFTSVSIDAVDGENHSSLTFSGGTFDPNDYWSVGQTIVVTACEDVTNNGTFTVHEVGVGYVKFWEPMAVNNSEDTAITFAPGFDWYRVVEIAFDADYYDDGTVKPTYYIDFLSLPGVECISIQESAASSVLYKKRMFREYHPDAKNQTELDSLAITNLYTGKDPLSTISVTTDGQTSSRYAGQTLDIKATPFGISNYTKYRVVKVHHRVAAKTILPKPGSYNYVTDYDLFEHSIGGNLQRLDIARINSNNNPNLATIDSLVDWRDRLYADDAGIEVSTYSRVPNDGELTAVFTTGLYADIPASAVTDTFYYCTDTQIWYRWDGAQWVEATRAEVKMRLAQFSERAHSSTSGVTTGQHHAQSHGSRHETVAGVDPIDTASDGSHSHTTNDTTGWVGTYGASVTMYAHTTSDAGSALTPFIGHTTGADISIVQSLNSAGTHTHDVTTSPTDKVEEAEDDPMIIIHEDKYTPDGHRVMDVTFSEFNHRETLTFPATRTDGQILKSIKQHWHNLWDYTNKNKKLLKSPSTLTGKKLKWDRDFEKKHMLEQSMDDGLNEWRDTMRRTIDDGTAHPDDVLRYNKHLDERKKKKKDLGLDS